ncbi:MAG: hypothetical protein H6595_06100 [Flavobacteriales bacterium]|nr:hypothetical protein [Flavobacteriales bacterium]MCB9167038.1 hypothetical protein [Flavobacteriales bacterium]
MTRSPFRAATVMAVLLGGWILLPSCNKEKPTKAIITIEDEDGHIVPEAYVKLYANPTYPLGDPSRLTQEMLTGSDGKAEFDYSGFYEQGQAGFAVLDIVSFKDSMVGEGIIKIVEEETNEETVTLVPVTP